MTIKTYDTPYGLVSLDENDFWFALTYENGRYWDEATLQIVKDYIDPTRNILEIGGHCGTSTLFYAKLLNSDSKIFVFEPQKKMYDLLETNIAQNDLNHKVVPYNLGVFCFNGLGNMTLESLDVFEDQKIVDNFAGFNLGTDGEKVNLVRIDSITLPDIGFIHCDAQGSENFIFAGSKYLIAKHRPVIFYEDNSKEVDIEHDGEYLVKAVKETYPQYSEEADFDIKKYCLEELNYSQCIEGIFRSQLDVLLIP